MSKVELYLDWNPFNGTEEEFLAVKEFKWKSWGENGKLHRIGGPARIWPDGAEEWRQNGLLHRADGPALIRSDGTMFWYKDGVHHREDGPAIIGCTGGVEYWINGGNLSQEDYYKIYPKSDVKSAEKIKTGVWITASEAPDNFNLDFTQIVVLYSKDEIPRNGNAYKIEDKWWINSGGCLTMADPISFFIVPDPELSNELEKLTKEMEEMKDIINIFTSDLK